jgi:tetratricopeptide (TPR) repeat protein
LPDEAAYYVRGTIFEAKGDFTNAIDDYTRADRISPGQSHVLESRAALYDRLGMTDEAERDRAAAEWLGSEDNAVNQARSFLNVLNSEGVLLRLSANGSRIVFEGRRMSSHHVPKYEELKADLLQILRDEC